MVGLYLLTHDRHDAVGRRRRSRSNGTPTDPGSNHADGQADDKTPPHVDELGARFVADSFTGAVVVRPRHLLAADALSGRPRDDWLKPLVDLGIDPRQAEQAELFFDPTPGAYGPYTFGGVIRFARPVDGKKLVHGLSPNAREATDGGQTYYVLEQPISGVPLAVCATDDHTLAAAPEPVLKKMLSAKGEKSPLIDRLREAEADTDVTAVVAVDAMRPLAAQAVAQFFVNAPPPLDAGAALGDKVNAVTLSVRLAKGPLVTVDVEARSAAAAGDVLTFVHNLDDQLRLHYGETRDGLLSAAPPDAAGVVDRFAADLQTSFTAKAEGTHVRLSVQRPAATKDLIAALAPVAPRLLGGPASPPGSGAGVLTQQGYQLQTDNGQPGRPVVAAFLFSNLLTPDAVQALASIKTLRSLSFYGTSFPEGSIRGLQDVAGLHELSITTGQEASEAALKEIKNLKGLHRLKIRGENLTDAVLAELKTLTELEELSLGDGPITDAGLRELKDLPRLHDLRLSARNVTPAGIKELHGLRSLTLWCQSLQDAGLADFQDLEGLYKLIIEGRGGNLTVGDVGLQNLAKVPSLHELSVPIRRGSTDAGRAALGGITELQSLELTGDVGSGEWLTQLRGLTGLRTLRLYGENFSERRAWRPRRRATVRPRTLDERGPMHGRRPESAGETPEFGDLKD